MQEQCSSTLRRPAVHNAVFDLHCDSCTAAEPAAGASTLEKPSGSKKPSGAVTPGKSCALMQTLEGAAGRATASFAPLNEAGANATAL
jgi:hypothetical protein